MRQGSLRIALSIGLLLVVVLGPVDLKAQASRKILARVNTKSITQEDLERIFKFRNVPIKLQAKVRAEFIDNLIDTELMQQFMKTEKITVSKEELDRQVKLVKDLLPKNAAGEVDLKAVGFTELVLREELALPLKWRTYVVKTVSDAEIEKYFEEHRIRFDGTEVRASQIFLPVESMDDPKQVSAGLAKLKKIRQEIEAGLPFADAAKKYSESPSKLKGGDMGSFLYDSGVSPQTAKVAFSLAKGEMSEPFLGTKGVHLCLVTDRKPGELSLEDARPQILQALSNELWTRKIKELKSIYKVERFSE